MLISFKFQYGEAKNIDVNNDWPRLREVIPALPEVPETYMYQTFVTDWKGIQVLATVNAKIELCDPQDQNLMFVRLSNRIEELELKKEDTAKLMATGAAVHIHIPDHSLTKIDEVQVLEDCCTDELQGYLDKDWRILAVCPPNAKRRPDYVLGRRRDPFRKDD